MDIYIYIYIFVYVCVNFVSSPTCCVLSTRELFFSIRLHPISAITIHTRVSLLCTPGIYLYSDKYSPVPYYTALVTNQCFTMTTPGASTAIDMFASRLNYFQWMQSAGITIYVCFFFCILVCIFIQ
jgi:hypothetical protein